MIAGLQWTEPVVVRQWQWQTQGLSEAKKLFWFFAKWVFVLCIPVLFFVYRVSPPELPLIATTCLALATLKPLALAIQVWASYKDSIRYSVEGRGLCRRVRGGRVFYLWKNVESYRVVKHSHIAGIGVLELKMRRSRRLYQWSFNPSQLDEQELIRAIQKHLPEHSLRSFDTRAGQPAI